MQMERVPDHYVEEIASLGMGYVDPQLRDRAMSVFGEDFVQLPWDNQAKMNERMERGYAYIHSPGRKIWQRAVGMTVALAGVPVSGLAAAWISLHAKENPFFTLQVALNDHEITHETKVQTMRPGAHQEPESPFKHASFISHLRPDKQDRRLLHVPGIRTIRKMGLDELMQSSMVAMGRMDLDGVRHYSLPELRGIYMLSMFTDKQFQRAGIGDELKQVFRRYPGIMKKMKPQHAAINVRTALTNGGGELWKLIHHGVRQIGDLWHVLNANPRTDLKMVLAVIRGRVAGGAWQGLQHLAGKE